MKKTKLTLLLLVVAMLVLTLCACQQTYDVTFELGYDNKTEVKTYDKVASRYQPLNSYSSLVGFSAYRVSPSAMLTTVGAGAPS